jgi:SAM-dependent methyltransferase
MPKASHGTLLRLRNRIFGRFGRYVGYKPTLANAEEYVRNFEGKHGLEIGGPSAIFRRDGLIPLYESVASLDGVNFSAKTIWEGELCGGRTYQFRRDWESGIQFILEATDLSEIPSGKYEFVVSSHSLEHTANPLLALNEWMRVMKPGGVLLLVLPHKEGTFDHRRPTTTLEHMINDYDNRTTEEDLTHLPEIIKCHDLRMDRAAGDSEQFRRRSEQNSVNRCLHHHVFDVSTALALVDHAGFQILHAETALPYHIIVLAEKAATHDNRRFVNENADVLRSSHFSTDRRRFRP